MTHPIINDLSGWRLKRVLLSTSKNSCQCTRTMQLTNAKEVKCELAYSDVVPM